MMDDPTKLTPDQERAAKSIARAFKIAEAAGLAFWDDCGTLCAYNSLGMTPPITSPDNQTPEGYRKLENEDYVMFAPSIGQNSDDPLYVRSLGVAE